MASAGELLSVSNWPVARLSVPVTCSWSLW